MLIGCNIVGFLENLVYNDGKIVRGHYTKQFVDILIKGFFNVLTQKQRGTEVRL